MRNVIGNLGLVRRRPSFGRFWLGIMISRSGDALTTVALAWLVLTIAGPRELGVALLCFGLPRILSGTIAGRLLDRFQPRVLLGWDNAVRGLLIALIPLFDHLDLLRIGHIYVIAGLSALLSSLTEVAEGALVPKLVESSELEAANSLLSINWDIAYIVAPALGGFAIHQIGAPGVLLIDAASFALMSYLCFGLPLVRVEPRDPDEPAADFFRRWLGLATLRRYPAVVTLTTLSVLFLFLNGMIEVFYPVFSREQLHADAQVYGLVVTAAAIGSFCGVLFGFMVFRRLSPPRRMSLLLLSGIPFFVLLAGVSNSVAAILLVAAASFLWGPYFVIERSLVQRLVPDNVRGEVAGARMAISSVGFPLGSAAAGLILTRADVSTLVLLMAGAYALLGISALVSRPLHEAGAAETQAIASSSYLASEPA
jgi:MFS family permease